MTGCIIENMSNRKLTYVLLGLVSLQAVSFLVGGLLAPFPNGSMQYLATKCVDLDGGTDSQKWFYPRGKGACNRINDLLDPRNAEDLGPDNIVFAVQMPHPRGGKQMEFSRWQQNMIAVLTSDIEYETGVEHDPKVRLMLKARIGHRNRGDPPGAWKEYASSVVHRTLECDIEDHHKKDKYLYNCTILPLFELGSLHHDFYLLNFKLPSKFQHEGQTVDVDGKLGRLKDFWVVTIYQNGGFTMVWVSLKTVFFPLVLAELWWFWRRLRQLPRPITLLEKTLLVLGSSLSLLNLPLEYATLSFDMPWLPLFNDVKQGIFYAALMMFWLIFSGEHLINDDGGNVGEKNGMVAYWKKISIVVFGSLCLLLFDICEKGAQLKDPFSSIWSTEVGTRLALGFIILAGISAGVFFLFLCYLIYRVFLTIAQKQASISAMSRVRRLHYQGIIWRFRFLMVATLITAAMTTVGFILGQVSEGQITWDENQKLEYNAAFMTGVYGMWNVYVLGLIFLYAPSHKQWSGGQTSESTNTLNENYHDNSIPNTGEEIEFSVSTVSGANDPSEMSSLTEFIRHQATD